MTKGFIHSVETFGTVDGPGIRYVLFLQGCPLRCKYCHNRDTWDMRLGQEITFEEVIADLKKYLSFYKNSGGGITISGGEPTLQMGFVTEIFKGAKRLGLNTALDTSGFTSIEKAKELLTEADLVLLDIKAVDPAKHQELTGVDNKKILSFAGHLAEISKPVWIRYVLIPGVNNSEEDLELLAQTVNRLANIEKVELLGYHKMGAEKWQVCGEEDPFAHVQAASKEDVTAAKAFLEAKGFPF